MLWHGDVPAGICVFTSAPRNLAQRHRFFGIKGNPSSASLKLLDRQLLLLSRVVLHPTYRGAGLASAFVRRSCESCPRPWIEAQAQMGWVNPLFEKAGFIRVGASPPRKSTRKDHSQIYGGSSRDGRQTLVTRETYEKSRYARPVYYAFDNRIAYANRDA
jgi:GNAT superfamily N-acetyltransferase